MSGVKKLRLFYSLLAVCLLACLTACESDTAEIASLLDARNKAVSEKNIAVYADLIADNYHAGRHTKDDVLMQIFQLFKRFQRIEMHTHNRHIDITDDKHALCEQSYTLKVFADQQWRSIVQKEQLELTKQNGTWLITSGL